MKARTLRQAAALLAVAGLLLAAPWLPSAEAHAMLVSAYPAPGASLAATPAEIRLTFSERIGLGSAVQLFGPQFRAVPGVVSGLDPAAPEQLRAIPPQLTPDTYTVQWTAVSSDGHTVSGSYAFAVTGAPTTHSMAPVWLVPAVGLAALLLMAAGGAAWAVAHRRRSRPVVTG